jgi:CheY-like chemotaxis protein
LASPLVVVVDNSATNLKILARLAGSLGEPVDVQAFADPAMALSVCAGQRPDLVVAAAEMAPLDAAAFIIRLREENGNAPAPVVVVAAHDDRAASSALSRRGRRTTFRRRSITASSAPACAVS